LIDEDEDGDVMIIMTDNENRSKLQSLANLEGSENEEVLKTLLVQSGAIDVGHYKNSYRCIDASI